MGHVVTLQLAQNARQFLGMLWESKCKCHKSQSWILLERVVSCNRREPWWSNDAAAAINTHPATRIPQSVWAKRQLPPLGHHEEILLSHHPTIFRIMVNFRVSGCLTTRSWEWARLFRTFWAVQPYTYRSVPETSQEIQGFMRFAVILTSFFILVSAEGTPATCATHCIAKYMTGTCRGRKDALCVCHKRVSINYCVASTCSPHLHSAIDSYFNDLCERF